MQLYICVMSLHAVHADVQVLSLGAIKRRDIPPLLLQEAGSTSNCTAFLGYTTHLGMYSLSGTAQSNVDGMVHLKMHSLCHTQCYSCVHKCPHSYMGSIDIDSWCSYATLNTRLC